jgi:hypothetical protein
MKLNEFSESMTCSECGGPAFSDLILAEKKDACYNKVRSRYKVWPSAYASGALVQCRKKGAANWGNKSEGVAEGVSLKQKHEDKKRADQNQVRYGKMTQAEFDKKWTRTERPKPTDKEQGVAEGNQEEKIGGRYDADDFDDMVSRLKKLAGAGPMKTVYDPDRRVYRNMPTAQQPAKQPKK